MRTGRQRSSTESTCRSIHSGSCGYGYIWPDEPLGWDVRSPSTHALGSMLVLVAELVSSSSADKVGGPVAAHAAGHAHDPRAIMRIPLLPVAFDYLGLTSLAMRPRFRGCLETAQGFSSFCLNSALLL